MNSIVSIFLLLLAAASTLQVTMAEDDQPEFPQLRIGVPDQRAPYSAIQDEKPVAGFLIDHLSQLCKTLDSECEFVTANHKQLHNMLQRFQVNTVLVIDAQEEAAAKEVTFSLPLCRIKPVLIQRNKRQLTSRIGGLKNQSIGVLENSLFAIAMSTPDREGVTVRPYPVLESAVIDLVTERLDLLLTDESFYQGRVANTALSKDIMTTPLLAAPVDDIGLPGTGMRLMIRHNDHDLLGQLNATIQASGTDGDCINLYRNTVSP